MQVTTEKRNRARAGQHNRPGDRSRVNSVRHVNLELFTLKDIPDIELDIILECLNGNEYGDAHLFAELFTGRCVFDHTDSQWYVWQDHYWKADDTQMVKHLVSGVLASTYIKAIAEVNLKIARLESQEQDEEKEAKVKQLKTTVKALNARAHSLKYVSRMKNVLSNAQAFLPLRAERWDLDRWALGTPEGVLDLRTGKLRPGKPEDYIRTIIPTTWRGLNEPCPRFEQFLKEIFEDRTDQERAALIAFLQRFLGYSVTGLTREHLVLLLFGDEGRNGKDTLIARLHKVLGSISTIANKDIMVNPGRISSPGACKPHLAFLQGKRIAVVSETDRGERFSAAQVKELSGGGDINARKPHGQEFTFSPSHTLILLTNNKPHADASDAAFWQRLCPVVFNMRFIDNPQKPNERKADKSLSEKLDAEASGILAWLVRGCLEWQRIGIEIPECVLKERANYREEEDTLGIFLAERCVQGKDVAGEYLRARSQALYTVYQTWSEDNGLKPMSSTAFGMEMGKRFTKRRAGGGVGNLYQGVGLRSDYPNEAEMADRKLLAEEEAKQRGEDQASQIDQAGPAPASLQEKKARRLLEMFRAARAKGYDLQIVDQKLVYSVPDSLSEQDRERIKGQITELANWLYQLLQGGTQTDFYVDEDGYEILRNPGD